MQTPPPLSLLLLLLTLSLSSAQPPPSDALSLLSFKSEADLDSKLPFSLQTVSNFCLWQGVKCLHNRVIRFNLQNSGLRGTLSPKLNLLTNLRVLCLRNNSLSGPIPNLSALTSLKTLFLDRNLFSGSFPLTILSLNTLLFLDLSYNNLTGSIPVQITGLDLLTYLRFDSNRFNGSFPPINQTYLKTFNASSNDFSGAVPVTASLSRFPLSSFSDNPRLCGAIIHVECRYNSTPPFFSGPNASVVATSPPPVLSESTLSPPFLRNHRRVGVVLGTVLGALVVAAALLCGITFCRSFRSKREAKSEHGETLVETSTKTVSETDNKRTEKSKLVFCEEDGKGIYTLEELMRASAELLGRGTVGTTYKAVMDGGRVAVSVKRLDSGKAIGDEVVFEGHMELVGGLRHPNLVPVRAYFQANEERLIVYDYQPNGSLLNLIHGSRSTRAKPLHWTSCLKIADDVAQGLAYIHQASRLVHGNLKSTNVLVGADFEACLTDYCLSTLVDPSSITLDLDSERYRAPEIRISTRVIFTPKSDVYAFGVLLLELLTGKIPSQHPYLDPTDMNDWVRAMRGGDDVEEDDRLEMLVQVASVCSSRSPEQRPSSRQVLKMIQDIKERVVVEDDMRNRYFAY